MGRAAGVLALACALLGGLCATAQPTVWDSHVNANVPAADSFAPMLKRDLLAYFQRVGGAPTAVDYRLLRDGPTQVGVGDPKFYAWVTARAGAKVIHEGAVRVAAIDGTQFEVLGFVPAASIRSDPAMLSTVFPADVAAAAIQSARVPSASATPASVCTEREGAALGCEPKTGKPAH